jgi:hypothetical protein
MAVVTRPERFRRQPFAVPAPAKWHPEIDTGLHTLMTVTMAAMLSPDVDVRRRAAPPA